MTNEVILKAYKGITDLVNAKAVLNIKVSYILAKNRKILSSFVEVIEHERINLYKKYGTETEEGSIKVSKENLPLLEKELNELMEIDNNVDIVMIKPEELEGADISLDVLEDLMGIIEE